MTRFQTLEQALGEVVCTFQRYCRKEGDRNTLSKNQLRSLLQTEMPSLQTLQIKGQALEEMLTLLDTDQDGEVTFEEYIRFVAAAFTFFHLQFRDAPVAQPRV
ncbi:protein S100-G-like [Pseudonaja textilis]|uniref:protein S100-G-like n=1 Tax=Pseudonaja textilis TaxID=8673 RepID=UPI000EAA998E|nr:protein S100-G-like [Pseudonaja textilis]XP_026579140.1 protein S100-G-like [Pseudonaja textilis]XP_026579141.1 protein S100-G-like [Pseudonaja textilis]